MRITVVAVGKLKERFWADACAEYLKRLGGYANVRVVEIPDRDPAKSGGEDAGRALEGKAILAAIPERSHVVLLDIGGKERSSEELAAHLDELMMRGSSSITFVIGGSCGVSDEVRARADERLSFGRITMPHNLARVVLLEQVYRAFKIMRGEPYHK
ncbi:MAG: 23S rRNA (pseudouridine(1915)-N(3))-methyltransferase RlmH [Coriobacteriaceae bacterium]|nr:23S rRNA (pseudouridine(1915)-N(3))-methyltransferase RlmH [Coriobacteriaceae bacterium]